MKNMFFDERSIAPCGMNCGTCIAYLRKIKPCAGCRNTGAKPVHCEKCLIKNCADLANTKTQFCHECNKYPCMRLKRLDKRYRTNYKISLIANLESVNTIGLSSFLVSESIIWKCKNCGNVLCVHRETCLVCKEEII